MATQLIVSFVVKPERVPEFLALLQNVKSSLPTVPGCEAVHMYQDEEKATRFVLVETWASRQHHQAHVESMQRLGHWDVLVSHLSADPAFSYHREL